MGISLKPIEEYDLDILRYWRNSDFVRKNCRAFKLISEKEQKNWFYALGQDPDDILFMLWDSQMNKSIGCGGIVRIDWKNRKGEVSFFIGLPEEVPQIPEALEKVIHYGLQELNLHKLYFPVYECNPFLKTYEQVMPREYVAKKEFYRFGKYWDRIILTRFNDAEKNNTKHKNKECLCPQI